MIAIKKINQNNNLSQDIIQKFCQQEKNILLNIIPEKDFFIYTLIYNNKIYKVISTYRDNILLKYNIFTINDLNDINEYLHIIYELLCKIICEQAKNDNITKNEEDFILKFLYNFSKNKYTNIILNYYPYLSNKIQKQINNIISYL